MPKVFLFDVDETFLPPISTGPVNPQDLLTLKATGHITGLCGNLNAFCTRLDKWWEYVSVLSNYDTGPFFGGLIDKSIWLKMFVIAYPHADEYILIGNQKGVTGASDDLGAVQRAGQPWRFIREDEWAAGKR